jgi:hypothetical protein
MLLLGKQQSVVTGATPFSGTDSHDGAYWMFIRSGNGDLVNWWRATIKAGGWVVE